MCEHSGGKSSKVVENLDFAQEKDDEGEENEEAFSSFWQGLSLRCRTGLLQFSPVARHC